MLDLWPVPEHVYQILPRRRKGRPLGVAGTSGKQQGAERSPDKFAPFTVLPPSGLAWTVWVTLILSRRRDADQRLPDAQKLYFQA